MGTVSFLRAGFLRLFSPNILSDMDEECKAFRQKEQREGPALPLLLRFS